MGKNTRGLEATRTILQADPGEASIVAHVEALALEPDEGKREGRIVAIGRMLAARDDAVEQAEALVAAFLDDLPRLDPSAEGPEVTGESMRKRLSRRALRLRSWLRREHPLAFKAGDELAVAPVPDEKDDEDVKIGPTRKRDDDRRDVRELVAAAAVLRGAVLADAALADVATDASARLRDLAGRARSDPGVAGALSRAADDLDLAVRAAGTAEPSGAAAEERDLVETAMRKGQDPDLVLRFSREWNTLHEHGGVRMSRTAYVQSNLRRIER